MRPSDGVRSLFPVDLVTKNLATSPSHQPGTGQRRKRIFMLAHVLDVHNPASRGGTRPAPVLSLRGASMFRISHNGREPIIDVDQVEAIGFARHPRLAE